MNSGTLLDDPQDFEDESLERCEDCGRPGDYDITGRCQECLDEWKRESAEFVADGLRDTLLDIAGGLK